MTRTRAKRWRPDAMLVAVVLVAGGVGAFWNSRRVRLEPPGSWVVLQAGEWELRAPPGSVRALEQHTVSTGHWQAPVEVDVYRVALPRSEVSLWTGLLPPSTDPDPAGSAAMVLVRHFQQLDLVMGTRSAVYGRAATHDVRCFHSSRRSATFEVELGQACVKVPRGTKPDGEETGFFASLRWRGEPLVSDELLVETYTSRMPMMFELPVNLPPTPPG